LSDAFSFEDIDKLGSDIEGAGEVLEMKPHSVSTKDATPADAGIVVASEASEGCAIIDDEDEAPVAVAASDQSAI
jgi:inositol hexakisphosphate/diphosphoinositol-pentakisphosphate kinase